MKALIFHPFQKVWTPRTPDSNYDSLGAVALPKVAILPVSEPAVQLDTTQAPFTVPVQPGGWPPAYVQVTIQIKNTGRLFPQQTLIIGNGAGAYQVVSITDPTHFVAENLGGAGNAYPGAVIPAGAAVSSIMGLRTGIVLESAVYTVAILSRSSSEGAGTKVAFVSGTYTAAT